MEWVCYINEFLKFVANDEVQGALAMQDKCQKIKPCRYENFAKSTLFCKYNDL